jgi:hypothetical protein
MIGPLLGKNFRILALMGIALIPGCVPIAQHADLNERRLKESNNALALAHRSAQQRQELEELKSEELPKLRGELERAQHQAQELRMAHDDLRQRFAMLEAQTRKVEQLSGKLNSESVNRDGLVRESLNTTDVKNIAARLDSLDEVASKILVHMEELEKRLRTLEKP